MQAQQPDRAALSLKQSCCVALSRSVLRCCALCTALASMFLATKGCQRQPRGVSTMYCNGNLKLRMREVYFIDYEALAGTMSIMSASCLAYLLSVSARAGPSETSATQMHARLTWWPATACSSRTGPSWRSCTAWPSRLRQPAPPWSPSTTGPSSTRWGPTPSLCDLRHSGCLCAWPHVQQSASSAQMVPVQLPAAPLGMLGAQGVC